MIHSFATYEFLFTTLVYYANNKNVFDEMLVKIDANSNSKDEPRKKFTRRNTTSHRGKQELRTTKTNEEELFGYSDSDEANDMDEEISTDRPSSVTYVYDDQPPIARSPSVTYVYDDENKNNQCPSVSYVCEN